MDQLKQRLKKELSKQPDTTIVKSLEWFLPVKSIEISFETVKRSKMDILMKMILITFQKADIGHIEELSEMLLVEPLFIKDLLDRMLRTKLIEKKNNLYKLTELGIIQLESGIFISERQEKKESALYSPCHEKFLIGEMKTKSNPEQKRYRYAKRGVETTYGQALLLKTLRTIGVESESMHEQITIEDVTAAVELGAEAVPCIEYRLYNRAEEFVYARVWNSLLGEWDAVLEKQLNDNERQQWHKEIKK